MIDLEIIQEEARREMRNFAEDTGILTDRGKIEKDPRLLSSGEMDKVNLICKLNTNKYKVM